MPDTVRPADRLKGNVFPWKSDTEPGMRVNWGDAVLALALMLVVRYSFVFWTWLTFLMFIIMVPLFGVIINKAAAKPIIEKLAYAGLAILALVLYIWYLNGTWEWEFYMISAGVGLLMGGIFAGIIFTRWWRYER
jgi:hypothetical protein